MAEIAIILVIVLLISNAIFYLLRNRRKGKNGCGCDRSCSHCTGCAQYVVRPDKGDDEKE